MTAPDPMTVHGLLLWACLWVAMIYVPMILVTLCKIVVSPPQIECPPEWKCNGRPETNDPACVCWDVH